MTTNRKRAQQMAQDYIGKGDPTGWFEVLYASAGGETSAISWADLNPNPNLTTWLNKRGAPSKGQTALVVGCGLGDDPEALAALGYQVTAFDISQTAVAWCGRRFPNSTVRYVAADALNPPAEWRGAFDLVVEIYTLQVLPPDLRQMVIRQLAALVAKGAALLVVARGRNPDDDTGAMPWPLTREELDTFESSGLQEAAFEDYLDGETPPVRRFRVEYRVV
jgi:SAM-dependent methyltransferase